MTSASGPILETPRLKLRPWRDDDLPALAAINADPRVVKPFPKPLTFEETQAALKTLRDHFTDHGYGIFAVEATGIPQIVGGVGLSIPPYDAPFTPCVEISWRIAHQFQGRGYATEAARAVLEFGFRQLHLDEILSFTIPANYQSWLLMERLGFQRSPTEDFDHPRLPPGHRCSRHLLYRLKRTDWESRQRALTSPASPPRASGSLLPVSFGRRLENRTYIIRPGSYALIQNHKGQFAIIEGPRGIGLPGGGADPNETPQQTLRREMLEECSREISIDRRLGFASEFVHSALEGNFEKRCTFFQASFSDNKSIQVEAGTRVLWLELHDALQVLTHESHRWAITLCQK